jgi:hypothetical protein
MDKLKEAFIAVLVVALVAGRAPALADGQAAADQAKAQAAVDAAIQEVKADVTAASGTFASDATPQLQSTASRFSSDSLNVENGLTAIGTFAESVALPPVALAKIASDLATAHTMKQQADAIDTKALDTCDQVAHLHDKLKAYLAFGVAANASQDDVLEAIKGMLRQGSGGDKTLDPSDVSSDLLQKLAQANTAASDINGFLIREAAADTRDSFYAQCGSFAGHFAASMTARFFTKSGQTWWAYETQIHGIARFHYSLKDVSAAQSGAPVPVKGELFGFADHFAYETDPFNTAYVKIVAGGKVDKTETAPAPQARGSAMTVAVAQTSPVGFVANVTGTMSPRDLTLNLTDSLKDFDPDYTQGETTAIVFSPLTNMLPVKTSYKLPYKNARWILDQFFGHGLTANISTDTSRRIAEFNGSRDRPANQNDAQYEIYLDVCDPACT